MRHTAMHVSEIHLEYLIEVLNEFAPDEIRDKLLAKCERTLERLKK